MPADTLTLLVTTYNRYPRLRRLLRYAASVQTPYAIHVLDSSSEPLALNELGGLLRGHNVLHRIFEPSTSPMQKLWEGLKEVSTPYVVLWADDDFLVPRSLANGVDFLERHQEYSVVHGHSALFTMETVHGQPVPGCMPYWQCTITHDTASQRLREYFGRSGVLNYAIHRTEHLRQHIQLCCQHDLGYWWGELALGSFAVIRGRVKRLNCLYLLKEAHQGMDSWATWLGRTEAEVSPDFFDWVTGPTFSQKYEVFRTCLAGALEQQDGTDLRTAQEVVKEAFWSYLMKMLANKWHQRYGGGPRRGQPRRLREAARRIPGLRAAWRRARYLLPHPPGELSLPALLHPFSAYHADFMPIYQAIMASDDASPTESCLAEAEAVR